MVTQKRLSMLAAAVALVALMVVAGCSKSGGSSGSGSGSSAGTSSDGSSSAVAKAKAQLAAATNTSAAVWAKPTTAFKPGRHRVAIIASGLAGGNLRAADQMTEATKAMGWTATVFDGKFDPNVQAGYVQQAVVQGYDAVILSSIDTQTINSAVTAALDKKIPVVCNECLPREGKVAVVTYDWQGSGTNMGDYIVAHSGCSLKIASFPDLAFPTVTLYIDGLTQEVKSLCPSAKIDRIPFPTSDLSKPGPPTWTAYLAAHPTGAFNWAATAYENQATAFAKTLADQGRKDVRITSLQSSLPETIQDISSGTSPFEATIFPPQYYESWASVDTAARLVTGAPMWDATKLPTLIVTKDNIAGVAKDQQYMPNFDFKAMFKKMWKVGG